MPRTSNRRWKGCPMCKPYKYAGFGDAERIPRSALRRMGGKIKRVSRKDIPKDD